MKEEIKEFYNKFGPAYHESRKSQSGPSYFYNENVEMPATLKLIGDCKNKKVLDLGCGSGLYAKILIEKGAIVKGIDFSEEMLNLARKEAPQAEFKLGDLEKLPYKNKEFDIVISSLALDHLENWDKVLSEVNRVLKSRGEFIFSIYNPVTDKNKKVKWFFRTFRIIQGYFNEGWRESETFKLGHHHKTYGSVVKFLINNGFEIIDYEDCKPIEDLKEKFPNEYARTSEAPIFCVWKVQKK